MLHLGFSSVSSCLFLSPEVFLESLFLSFLVLGEVEFESANAVGECFDAVVVVVPCGPIGCDRVWFWKA